MKNPPSIISPSPGRSTDYKNRLRGACSGLRAPAAPKKRTVLLIDILTEGKTMTSSPPEPEMTVETALARLRQYQERPAKTWSTATYTSSDEQALAAIAHTLAQEVQGGTPVQGTSLSDASRIYPVIRDVLVRWQNPDNRAQAELVGVDLAQDIADSVVRQQQSLRPDTLGAWIYQRYANQDDAPLTPWSELADEDKDYWEHEAAAVRRAAARGGFKNPEGDGHG